MVVLSRPEPVGDLFVRSARPGEEDVVLDLLAEVAAWLRSRGIEQWPRRFPAGSVRGALLVERAGRPVATLAVADEDPALWGEDTAPAYHLSRLAVARAASGAGLGYRLVDWVAHQAAEHGRRYVRLATARDNPALRRYYERAGFEHVTDPPQARWPTSLYQRQVPHRARPEVGGVIGDVEAVPTPARESRCFGNPAEGKWRWTWPEESVMHRARSRVRA